MEWGGSMGKVWHVWRGGNIMRWQFGKGGRVVSREAGMEFKTKLCCIAPEKRNASRDSLKGFYNSYIMFWIDEVS